MSTLSRREFIAASVVAAAVPSLASRPGFDGPGDAHRGPCCISSYNGLRCVNRAWELMTKGYDPADCVVQAVRIIEDDPNDDGVGFGGLPNEEGVVELDASVMHGPTHKSGAVAGIRDIKNPAMVALLVLRRTDHVLLVGEGARRFALQHGFVAENLLTEASRKAWLKWKENMSLDDDRLNDEERDAATGKVWEEAAPGVKWEGDSSAARAAPVPYQTGTVHCSIVNDKGDIASCTSTSGLSWKIPGRIGDSPIIGAGNYCDNLVGAAGCTGRGEAAAVNLAAYGMVRKMEDGATAQEAAAWMIKRVADRTKEKRLINAGGKPKFNISCYAVRKDGAYGAACMYPGGRFAVHDGTQGRLLDAVPLFEGKP